MSDTHAMTEERLREIEARVNAATEGPWKVVGRNYTIQGFPQVEMNTPEGHYFPVNFPHDADFVAAARTDIPDLIAALNVEREKTNRLRSTLSTVATELERLNGKALEGGMDLIDVSETVALVDAILAETQS